MPRPTRPSGIPCLSCDTPLELHQPDSDTPERLLGTCPACGAWFILDGREGPVPVLPAAGRGRTSGRPQSSANGDRPRSVR